VSERSALALIGAISAAALGFLIWLIYFAEAAQGPAWVAVLPTLNACFNASSSVLMVAGILAIKRGRRDIHLRFMLGALLASTLFLLSYIAYHHFHGDTKFAGVGWIRPVYFFILISHIILSAVVLPLLLATVYFAATDRLQRHKPLARIVFPLWLYVSISGVAVYFFLKAQY
jgi:putative membrane protein